MSRTSKSEQSFELDMNAVEEVALSISVLPVVSLPTVENKVRHRVSSYEAEEPLLSCLRNEIIEVRFIPLPGRIVDPKNPLFGGMGENSITVISVPRQRSGTFVNILTNSEKRYLEYIMGLEDNALSIYNKKDNFWSNATEGGISKVILNKRDNRLNLGDPEDYIRYKILLADKEHIAPDLLTLLDKPKATYKFVLVSNTETNSTSKMKFNAKKLSYMEYGKIENNYDILKAILEMITMKPVSKNTKLDFLLVEVGKCIEENPKTFLDVARDLLLPTKVLIKKAVDAGLIAKRTNYYYLKSNGEPLCEAGEEATLTVAAKFLDSVKNQEIKLAIEARLNQQID